MKPTFPRRAAFALPALLAAPASAQTGDWPQRPVRIIVPAAGGGSSDPIARFLAQAFTQRFGQGFVVENRPGAAGNVGMTTAARAAPDGYTLLFGFAGPLATNLALYADLPFHTQRHFDAVVLAGGVPNALIVGPQSPLRSLADFLAAARARPGTIGYGTTGSGSSMHLAGTVLSGAANVELNHIPYSSPGAMTTDVIAGRLDSAFLGTPGTVPLHRAGTIRALAVLAERRAAVLPDIPTAIEQGLPGVVMGTWFALMAPKGTPPAIIRALNAAANEAIHGPGRETLAGLGLELDGDMAGGTPEQAEAFLAAEIARHAGIVRRANIRVE
ncbi:MAG: tripartite tricarboxylate transporter substrate binding protein [Acetobacteraceae bacterium]|nr:tripartite tricarboxylate transporter substrate binding protein [Acetobacteraceae bacterium]